VAAWTARPSGVHIRAAGTTEIPVRNHEVLIGIRPEFQNGSVAEGQRANFQIVALNADGQRICPLAVAKLVQWPSQKVTGLPRATAPSFRANLRLGARRPLSSTLTALRALLPGLQRGLSPLPSRGPGIDY